VHDRTLTFEFKGRRLLLNIFPNKVPRDIEHQRALIIMALKDAFPKGSTLDLVT
jgi:hypothetical protein